MIVDRRRAFGYFERVATRNRGSRPLRCLPGWILAGWLAALVPVLVGCGGEAERSRGEGDHASVPPAAPPPGDPRIREALTAGRFDLAALLPLAERWSEVERIRPGAFEDRGHLTSGWSFGDENPDNQARDSWPVWSDSTTAEVTFLVREVAAREVDTMLEPLLGDVRDFQRIRGWLNGAPVMDRRVPPGRVPVTLPLPAAAQRPGLNRLRFAFSRCLRPVDVLPGSEDFRALSTSFDVMQFRCLDEEVDRRAREARELIPEGIARAAASADDRPSTVEQVSGSELAYFLAVPPSARFSARGAYLRAGSRPPAEAVFRVVVTTRDGEERRVAEVRAPAGGDPVPIVADLSAFAETIVRVDLRVAAGDGSAEPVLGAWIEPRIAGEGPAALDRPPAIAASVERKVASMRERLQGAPVVLILLDACDPLAMSGYGGRQGLTPHVDRLAEEGTLFEHAASQASYTIASVGSMLSSRYTWEHGAWCETTRWRDGIETIPERFAAAGYRTAGITHSTNGSSVFGFEKGFESWDEVFRDHSRTAPHGPPYAGDVFGALDRVLEGRDNRPLFLWIHLIEPHEPYLPPDPWRERSDREYAGSVHGDGETLWKIRKWSLRPTRRDVEHLRAEYEDNLGYVDDVLGGIRERLEAAGIFDEAIVAVFSDHGEGFLAHEGKVLNGMGHGATAYEEMVHVPLIVKLPRGVGGGGRRAKGLVSGMDLLPTVADLTGVALPAGVRGRSFAAMLADPNTITRSFVLSHSQSFPSKRFLPSVAIRGARWKLVLTSGDEPELYDLDADPGERQNLAAGDPILVGWLRQTLLAESGFDATRGGVLSSGSSPITLDEETIERMKALGYLR